MKRAITLMLCLAFCCATIQRSRSASVIGVCAVLAISGAILYGGYRVIKVCNNKSMIPRAATYDGNGEFEIRVTPGKQYTWIDGGNHDYAVRFGTNVLNRSGTLTAEADRVYLIGIPDQFVQCVFRRGEVSGQSAPDLCLCTLTEEELDRVDPAAEWTIVASSMPFHEIDEGEFESGSSVLQKSSDLKTWRTVGIEIVEGWEQVTFIDSEPARDREFYRVLHKP